MGILVSSQYFAASRRAPPPFSPWRDAGLHGSRTMETSSAARPALDADLGNLLDPERGREAKQGRVRRLNQVFIPLLRAAGMALLFVLVVAHHRVVTGVWLAPPILTYGAFLIVYCLLSWIVLARFYQRMRARRPRADHARRRLRAVAHGPAPHRRSPELAVRAAVRARRRSDSHVAAPDGDVRRDLGGGVRELSALASMAGTARRLDDRAGEDRGARLGQRLPVADGENRRVLPRAHAARRPFRALADSSARSAIEAAARGERGSGSGESPEERIPRQREPRIADADERGDRHDGPADGDAAVARADRLRAHRADVRRAPARDHQRHSRRVEDGRGSVLAVAVTVSAAADRGRRRTAGGIAGGERRGSRCTRRSIRTCRHGAWRTRAASVRCCSISRTTR